MPLFLSIAKRMSGCPRYTITVSILTLCIFLLSTCINTETEKNDPISDNSDPGFVGSSACQSCHQSIYEDHLQTAHYLSSDTATPETVRGSFQPGKNNFFYNNSVRVSMEKRGDSLYQVEYFRDTEKKARRFDIVVGSGTKGQSFLNWRNDHLFQLPITYFSAADQWSNSPGFPDKIIFNRIITSRCLECHATYAKTIPVPDQEHEQFDASKMIYGIDCEKCHGAGAEHVKFQASHPNDTTGKYIANPATFSRQQNLDLCALCHGGRLQKTSPSFSFKTGDRLSDFFRVDTSAPDPASIDVHGNQYGLLRASECFRQSKTMTCNSCHDPHENQKGQLAGFSEKCMSCHSPAHNNFCPMEKQIGPSITGNCIDCHMPVKSSRAIAVFLPGKDVPTAAQIRSHYIAVYPEETKKLIGNFLPSSKSSKKDKKELQN